MPERNLIHDSSAPSAAAPTPESTKWPLIPEFQDIAVPIAGAYGLLCPGRSHRILLSPSVV